MARIGAPAYLRCMSRPLTPEDRGYVQIWAEGARRELYPDSGDDVPITIGPTFDNHDRVEVRIGEHTSKLRVNYGDA